MTSYVHGHHESVLRSHQWRTAANSCAYLLPHLRPGLDLLDVGCGPGTISADLARIVSPGGRVLAVDAAAEVIEAARAGSTQSGVGYAVMDAYALDIEPESFDVVHAHQVLQHLEDPVAALVEMRRVTRPGGLVAVRDADYAAMTWYPASQGLERWRELYSVMARRQGGEPDAGRHLLSWARAAGFASVEPSASVWCFATPQDRTWWGTLQADRTAHSRFAELALSGGLADEDDLAELAGAWRAWASQDDGWFAVLHGEALCHVG